MLPAWSLVDPCAVSCTRKLRIRAQPEPFPFIPANLPKLITQSTRTEETHMSEAQANKDLARRWFEEVWNQGRESTIDELFHPQGKAYGFPDPGSILIGPEGFKTTHPA